MHFQSKDKDGHLNFDKDNNMCDIALEGGCPEPLPDSLAKS